MILSKKVGLKRLLSKKVGYMRLRIGTFHCGACKFLDNNDYCKNKSVRTIVDPYHGCCNLFYPAGQKPLFPPSSLAKRRTRHPKAGY